MSNFLRQLIKYRSDKLGKQIFLNYSTSENLARKLSSEKDCPSAAFGQPTSLTHPHLLKDGDLIPGIKLDEFKNRRTRLVNEITKHSSSVNNHLIIVPSASKVYMSDKIPYVFRQNTDFLYFSGCQEPDSVLILSIKDSNFNTILFVNEKDARSELWDGPRTGVDASKKLFGVDESHSVSDFPNFISNYVNNSKDYQIWYNFKDIVQLELHNKLLNVLKNSTLHLASPQLAFHNCRLIKSPSEIELMKRSCQIGSKSIVKTMETSRLGVTEHELFATVDYHCRMNGANYLAYPPVVAAGNNANIIHYIANNQIIRDGEMVLMDAGCEYHGYTSDITRTWPINGTFSPPQRTLYEIVLEVQKILIQQVANYLSLEEIFRKMIQLLGKYLQEENLIPKNLSQEQVANAAFTYCPHHVGHFLGMDVHDTSKIQRTIKTQPGMIITIEPGIYVNSSNPYAPPEFHGQGIRIEDDVLVTDNGPLVLTASCPKEIHEIEELIKKNQRS